jgi:hypothetical protein
MVNLNLKRFIKVNLSESQVIFLQSFIYFLDIIIFSGIFIFSLYRLVTSDNILLSRIGGDFSGHTLFWLSLSAFAIYVRIKLPHAYHHWFKYTIQSIIIPIFAMVIIEGMFQIGYTITYIDELRLTQAQIGIVIGLLICLIFKTDRMFEKYPLLIAIFATGMFVVIWQLIGMPTTITVFSLGGKTQFFYSSVINLIEDLQWILGIGIFYLAFRYSVNIYE